MTRRATLHDVAAMAGVSIKTASRVVNNERGVAPETLDRVTRAIDELDYVPNRAARALIEGKTGAIGLVTDLDQTSLFASTLIANVLRDTRRHDYNLLLFSGNDDATRQVGRALLGRQVDGVILLSRASENADLLDRLSTLGQPCVAMHPTSPEICGKVSCVRVDEVASARRATDYLIGLGHRNIGIISHPLFTSPGFDRLRGYRQALDDSGIPFRSELIFESDLPFGVAGHVGASRLVEDHRDMTALVAFTDEIAIGAIGAIWQLGLKVPDDISVIGFNDTTLASVINPPITAVHLPLDEVSRTAVDLLIGMVERPTSETVNIVLPTAIAFRGSCRSPRSEA